jgi:membrane protease YdiL (CAAX protease family)
LFITRVHAIWDGVGERLGIVWSCLIPVLYSSVVYVFAWLTGLGRFSVVGFVGNLASQFGLQHVLIWITAVEYLVVTVALGTLVSCITALGEEIGWRGLLVPNLAKITTYSRVALISGVI